MFSTLKWFILDIRILYVPLGLLIGGALGVGLWFVITATGPVILGLIGGTSGLICGWITTILTKLDADQK